MLERHLAEIETRGYTILEQVIEPELVDALGAALLRLETELAIRPGANLFEGDHTIRIYNLLAHDRVFERVPVHPTVLPIVERVLDRGCLISSLSSISIDPGEDAQPIHADDTLINLPRPHPALVCNSMWALTDFTEENGATRVVPGSHRFPDKPEFGRSYDSVPAEMPKGSVLVWNGSLWHGGGANSSASRRVGIAMNNCAGFIRQQENQQLGIPLERVRGFTPRLQELAGFGTYRNLIGHIEKRSPMQAVLGVDDGFVSVWDLVDPRKN
ncbi:MAG: phytanoyl-CoA dioxygenase family protein [Pseudomonadales bacterium]|nr:phytanoyl-CoA dioxygenase family protein [Pseudomonadales bacterium]